MRFSEKGSRYCSKNNKQKKYVDIYSNDPPRSHGYVDIYSSERKSSKTRGKISVARILFSIFFLILGTIGGMMLYVYNTLHSFNYDDLSSIKNSSFDEGDISELMNDSMVLNTLLIGSDSMSNGDHGRSDSLLVLSLNMRSKKIKITSIMRDTWVNIPGYGKDRINAAFAYGGPRLSIETVERNFGISIDRYAAVDFEGFSKIIDTLGGIDLELTSAECAYINQYSGDKHTLRGSGVKHLTGLQALHYSRDRNSIGSDYDRTNRQRNVIKTVIGKMKTANIGQITELIATLGPLVTTNFKTSEISRLATASLTYLSYPIEDFRIPTDDNVRNETYDQKMVLVINDMAKARKEISKFIYDVPTQ